MAEDSTETTRIREHLRVVSEAAQAFAEATTDYERLLDIVASVVSERVGDACGVFLVDESRAPLRTVALQSPDLEALAQMRAMFAAQPLDPSTDPVSRRVLDSGEALLVPHVAQGVGPDDSERQEELEQRIGLHSYLLVALRAHGRSLGLLTLGRFRPSSPAFNDHDRELAQNLADHASLAIQNARLYSAVQEAREAAVHAEERARKSEQMHRFFFESSPIPTFVFHAEDRRLLAANAAALELYGYTLDEFLALRLDDLRAPEQLEELTHALRTAGKVMRGAGHHRCKDGRIIFVEGRNHLTTFEGHPARFVVVQDQTERVAAEQARRESESRLQRTLDMMMEGYTILGHDLRYLYSNEVGARHARLPKEQMVGRTPMELNPGFTGTGMYELLMRSARERVPVRMEEEATLPDGKKGYFEVNIRPVEEGLVVLSIDVTERRRAELLREALEEQLRQSQRMDAVGRLAGGVAHDFNNILSIILGYGETLLEDLDAEDPKRADVLEIHKAAGRAAELTKQLLMFSRQQLVEPKVLDLNAVLGGMETMLRRLLGEHIELAIVRDRGIGRIRADRGNIEQVIMNLVVNARDAMPQGGKLTIETANVVLDEELARVHLGAEPGHYVLLAVADTGHGMDKETRLRIFEPFFTTKEPGKGTGLGLATAFGIVQQSHGGIWVYSEPGCGSTFKVYLPRTDAAAEPRSKSVIGVSQQGSETILLVEDEEAVRVVAHRMLQRHGYRVLVAQDSAHALRLAEDHGQQIDLLMTDVVMPRMSGAALAARLTARWPAIKVLYVSGYTDGTVMAHGVLESGVPFLQKPFTSEQLARKLRGVLDEPAPAATTSGASVA